MSTEAAARFRAEVNQNEALQREVRQLEQLTPDEVAGMAARHGYDFTAEEIADLAGTLQDELTEFELEMVTGGEGREVACWRQGMRAADDIAPGYGSETERTEEPIC